MSEEIPRWRLRNPHYLNTEPSAVWRHEETSQASGEKTEVNYQVPRYLDPGDPKQCNRDGDLIVCHGKGEKGDWSFIGPPTPEMEPMNDAAQAITDAEAPKWEHPIESLSNVADTSMITQLQRENATLKEQIAKSAEAPARRM